MIKARFARTSAELPPVGTTVQLEASEPGFGTWHIPRHLLKQQARVAEHRGYNGGWYLIIRYPGDTRLYDVYPNHVVVVDEDDPEKVLG